MDIDSDTKIADYLRNGNCDADVVKRYIIPSKYADIFDVYVDDEKLYITLDKKYADELELDNYVGFDKNIVVHITRNNDHNLSCYLLEEIWDLGDKLVRLIYQYQHDADERIDTFGVLRAKIERNIIPVVKTVYMTHDSVKKLRERVKKLERLLDKHNIRY